jgi:hypothetical protein
MRAVVFLVFSASSLSAQVTAADSPFLLRLEHANSQENSCVLIQKNGSFHLEVDRNEQAKIFEGTMEPGQLSQIQHTINSNPLATLSQRQIQEPLMIASRDTLQLDIFREDHWQDLLFESIDSQEPYRPLLHALVRWLSDLRKLPHKEYTEEEGRNNCLPPRPIVLKKRAAKSNLSSGIVASSPKPTIAARVSPPVPLATSSTTASPLVRVSSFKVGSGEAIEKCVLVAGSGQFRSERRTQKNSSRQVKTVVVAGNITTEEISQLKQVLADPALVKIGHHEPSGHAPVPMMGDVVEISIARNNGTQRLVLSSGFNRRQMGFFYGGDGDLKVARPLIDFLAQHVENKQAAALDPTLRNNCTAP